MRGIFRKSSRSNPDPTPGTFSLEGKPVRCPHCDGAQFVAGQAQLNTALASLFELDWLNETAIILSCVSCGQIQWFAKEPARSS